MKTSAITALLALLTLSACNPSANYSNSMPVGLNTIPKTFEKPEDTEPSVKTSPQSEPDLTQVPSFEKGATLIHPKPPEAELKDNKNESTPVSPSQFIKNAEWIMLHEGRRIGTACNRFVSRILEYSGYSGQDFLANDFDLYARKYFSSYKAVDFKNDADGLEIARLKGYLWSYPERTAFIMQWSRSGMHGHIAVVERIKDYLIIYQANLNKFTARKDQTTVQSLLSGFNRRTLTVYSEFKK